MTAAYLISEIFSRVQRGLPSNLRRLSQRQFDSLLVMISVEDSKGVSQGKPSAVRQGDHGGLVWCPRGDYQYVISEGANGAKRTIVRLVCVGAGGSGSLFAPQGVC
jgi:hypothetical protein